VINRLCKHIINTSDDSDLVIESAKRTDEVRVQAEAAEEVEEFSNSEVIDVDSPEPPASDEVIDVESPEEDSGEPSPEEQEEIRQRELADAKAEADDRKGPDF